MFEHEILIYVQDNGLGINLDRFDKQLFQLYKRFHPHIEGKGMGLHMVKLQVEALGGKISVVSEVDKGTTFEIRLPFNKIYIQTEVVFRKLRS